MNESEPLIRVMALHALLYCERLYYLEEVEEIRVADDRVYAGRALHEELLEAEAVDTRSFELESDALGIRGKLDALRHRDGGWVPYEHKRGRPHRDAAKQPGAWESDAVQVSAYGMLLEEHLGRAVAEGRIRYHAENVTVRVPLDLEARQRVRAAIDRARELRSTTARPPVAANDRVCIRCSLAPVCLPEEERLAADPQWEAVRLFPPAPDGQVLHLTVPGTQVGRSGETLVVKNRDEPDEKVPLADVEALVLHGNVQITTQALHLCAANEVPVHWFTGGGSYVGALACGPGGVQRRIRQFEALTDAGRCLELARKLALAKVETQLRFVLRSTRGDKLRAPELEEAVTEMRRALEAIPGAASPDSLRGHEGSAARAYFRCIPHLLAAGADERMTPQGRSRRPPRDPFNALLSFGYGLLYRSVLQALLVVGLEPALGFYHTPRSAAHPLVLDLMELFRVPLWDLTVIGSINRRQWDVSNDFQSTRAKVWLSEIGRRKAIELYERRLAEKWRHPVIDYSLTYARAIELEARLLEKEWAGHPGLFARMRLR